MDEHRKRYPEQYSHPLIGSIVQDNDGQRLGKVERVVNSRFGKLAIIEGKGNQAWLVSTVKVVKGCPKCGRPDGFGHTHSCPFVA